MTDTKTDPGTVSMAMDAGQTGTKIRIDANGHESLEAVLPGVRTSEPLLPQLMETIRLAAGITGQRADVVSIGVSGLTDRDADAAALLYLVSEMGTRRVLLTHDSVTSFLGTLGDARGAVVAAGTGVVTLGVGRSSVARIDGWGNIMGDAGSAYWIGREALDSVMRAHDGRGPATALTDAVRVRWQNLEDAYIDLQTDPDRVRIVASFAEPVSDLASVDRVAAGICTAAARELSHSVVTALARVGDDQGDGEGGVHVSAIGGVFSSPLIREQFEQLVRSTVQFVQLERPRGTGLDGAAALPGLAAGHPLRSLVATAVASP